MRFRRQHKIFHRSFRFVGAVAALACGWAPRPALAEAPSSGLGHGLEQLTSLLVGNNKFDAGFGGYAITARSGERRGSLAGLGLYQFTFRRALGQKIEATLGYTIYFSQIFRGDSGAGIDIGLNYFPLSAGAGVTAAMGGQRLQIEEAFRPYVGAVFSQRTYQSVQASYNGFGLQLGAEHSLWRFASLNATVRYIRLSGGDDVSATELGGVAGISVRF